MNNLLAQVDIGQTAPGLTKFGTVGNLISVLSRIVAYAGAFFVVAALVYTGYLYMSASGDTKNIEKSKIVLTYAVIGMLLISVAYWLTQIIARFLGTSF